MPGGFKGIMVYLGADASQLKSELVKAGAAVQGFGKSVEASSAVTEKATKAHMASVSKASMVVGAGLTAAFGFAAKAAMGFDKEMSAVAAASDATASDMAKLRQAALDAGAATAFSASQAAQAESELAKAGISTADILGGALRGSLDLAAAGSLGLARAAEISAESMTVFKLEGRDVAHIADVLSAGANKSSADVEGLAQSLQQSGLVAAQFGLSLEDTVGTLAMFAQAGLKGSDAGTSLKTMLQRFVPSSEEAARAMAELGIEMFDASGKFVGITGAAQELKEGLSGLSEEQRAAALTTIFGSDAIRAATILYQGGGQAVDEWRAKVDDAGAASETAAKKLDNLSGDLEALKGSIETALIESGSSANGVLRAMAQAATRVVNGFGDLPGPAQAAGTAIAGVGGVSLLALGTIGSLAPKVAEARRALGAMGPAGVSAYRGLAILGRTSLVLGSVYALKAGLDAVGMSARGVEIDLAKLSTATSSRLVSAFREVQKIGQGDALFAKLLEADTTQAQRLVDALRDAGEEVGGYQRSIDKKVKAEAGAIVSGEKHAAKVEDVAAAMRGETKATKEATEALEDRLDALASQVDSGFAYERSLDGLEDAQKAYAEALKGTPGDAATAEDRLKLEQANIAVAAAQERLNKAMGEHGADSSQVRSAELTLEAARLRLEKAQQSSGSKGKGPGTPEEQRRALLSLKESYVDVAQAAARQAEDQAVAAGKVFTATERYNAYRNKLIELKDTVAPGSELRAGLEEIINKLAEIPAEKTTVVKVDTSLALAELAALRGGFAALTTAAALTVVPAIGAVGFGPLGALGAVAANAAAGGQTGGERFKTPWRRRHSGGLISGHGEVPTLLEAGEYVIRKEAVRDIGSVALERLNRMHTGGQVGTTARVGERPARGGTSVSTPAMAAASGATPTTVQHHYHFSGEIHGVRMEDVENYARRKQRVSALGGSG